MQKSSAVAPKLNAKYPLGLASGIPGPRGRQLRQNGCSHVAQVQKQNVAELGAGPPPQSVENGLVLPHGRAQAILVGTGIGRKPRAAEPTRVARICIRQCRVARRGYNALMDQSVDLEVVLELAAQIKRVHLMMQSFDFGNLLVGDTLAGEPAGQRLEAAHQIEKIANILLAEAADARAV